MFSWMLRQQGTVQGHNTSGRHVDLSSVECFLTLYNTTADYRYCPELRRAEIMSMS